MREHMVRLSFDIPEDEHLILKIACAQARLAIKDFVHGMILKGIKDLQKAEFEKKLKESVQQAKNGRVRRVSSKELEQWESELENDKG